MLRNQPGGYSRILNDAGFEIVYPEANANTLDPEVIAPLIRTVDAMLASTDPLTAKILTQSSLKAVARMGVGYDSIDITAASQLGIAVTIAPGCLEESVAEQTIALMFGLTRNVVGRDAEVRSGIWSRTALPRMAGKVFGLVGLGRIGRVVAQRMQGLGMRVIAFDPFPDKTYAEEQQIQLVTWEELLQSADIVSLHAASTKETADLVDANALAQMKSTAFLINTSRGGLIDEVALQAALESGQIAGAGLDVFKEEPPPTNHPLLHSPNVLVCTHMGGLDLESEISLSSVAAQCLVDLYRNQPPIACMVNPDIAENWQWDSVRNA